MKLYEYLNLPEDDKIIITCDQLFYHHAGDVDIILNLVTKERYDNLDTLVRDLSLTEQLKIPIRGANHTLRLIYKDFQVYNQWVRVNGITGEIDLYFEVRIKPRIIFKMQKLTSEFHYTGKVSNVLLIDDIKGTMSTI